jgi:hypothetical protein
MSATPKDVMLTRPVREKVRVTFRDRLKAFEFESTDGGHEHEVFFARGRKLTSTTSDGFLAKRGIETLQSPASR